MIQYLYNQFKREMMKSLTKINIQLKGLCDPQKKLPKDAGFYDTFFQIETAGDVLKGGYASSNKDRIIITIVAQTSLIEGPKDKTIAMLLLDKEMAEELIWALKAMINKLDDEHDD